MADDSKITGSSNTDVDVSKIGTLKLTNDINVTITQNGGEGVQSIKEVEKTNSNKENNTENKIVKKSLSNQLQILNEIRDTLENLNTAAQSISMAITGNAAEKSSNKSSGSGIVGKNPFDGLQEVIGQAGFRTSFKDALVLGLTQWLENSDVQNTLKSALSHTAEENATTPITAPKESSNNESGNIGGSAVEGKISNETENKLAETGDLISNITETQSQNEEVSKIEKSVEKIEKEAVDEKINTARTDTNDEIFNGLNESLKNQKEELDSQNAESNQMMKDIDKSIENAAAETKKGSKDSEKIYKVALVEVNNDMILGDKDLKTLINDTLLFQEKMTKDNAASNGSANENETKKLDSIASEKTGKESNENITKEEGQKTLEKKLVSNIPKEEKNAPKGESILQKFEGFISKKYASLSPKEKEEAKKKLSSGIKAGGKIMQFTGKTTKFVGKGIGAVGKGISKIGSKAGSGIVLGTKALGGVVSKIPFVGGVLSRAIAKTGSVIGKETSSGSKTIGGSIEKTGAKIQRSGGKTEATGKTIAKNADKIADELSAGLNKKKTGGVPKESGGSKLSILTQILLVLKGILSINKKSASKSASDALYKKQFGSMKGGDKKKASGGFSLTELTKSLKSAFAKLPESLAKSLMLAKLKMIMMIVRCCSCTWFSHLYFN